LNPALDSDEVRANLPDIRLAELDDAARIIGYDEVALLGYRDSGMPDSPANDDPRCFARAPLEEAVGRLVTIIRRERPHVIIGYGPDQRGYLHPDHLRAHEIAFEAFACAGDPDAYKSCGEAHTPLKLYYTTWTREQFLARHEKFVELGLESPYEERIKGGWLERMPDDEDWTCRVDLAGFEHIRFDALRAHATQIDPTSAHWFGLPAEIEHEIHSYDTFFLAENRVGPIAPENDLFAGVRELLQRA
jgi:mycothiol S-conjugate amidase